MNQYTDVSTDKQKKQRRFLLVLPLIVLPFLTFLLWSMGWVGGSEAKGAQVRGLNMQLPDAKLADNRSWNKLSFYEQADKDSFKYKEAIKNDPLFRGKDSLSNLRGTLYNSSSDYNPLPPGYTDENEYKASQKLAELNAALNKPAVDDKPVINHNTTSNVPSFQPAEVDRLEHLLQAANGSDSETDPETKQLNGMMDKILDIQHPERVAERMGQESQNNQRSVYPVVTGRNDNYLSLLAARVLSNNRKKGHDAAKQNGFYSMDTDTAGEQMQNAIKAIVEETQTVVSGSVMKLSLQTDVYIGGVDVPTGTFVWGTTSLANERLNISITSIRYRNNLLPVALSVYDMDGMPGICIPGSISRDAAKQSGSEAISNIGVPSLEPSITAQAASAGIQAAKSLLNKKVKQVKVTVKGGYQVLLKDNNQK